MSTAAPPSHPDNHHHLPTTTTFLPILDDLLSPDFRPVTLPPVVTPLQTPTTHQQNVAAAAAAPPNVNGVGGGGGGVKNEAVAAVKIQKWWKNSKRSLDSCGVVDGGVREERVKHTIRHRRAEDHIRALESEVTRLKSSLATERKLRSLQYEAIRSLWSQVQKLTVNNPSLPADLPQNNSIMSMSLPNGIPAAMVNSTVGIQPTPPPQQKQCCCSSEIASMKEMFEDFKATILQEIAAKNDNAGALDSSTTSSSGSGGTKVNKRPDSLDLNGGKGGSGGVNAKPEEIQGYANEMAKFVVERGISDKLGESGDGGK